MRSENIRYLPAVDHLRAIAAIWIVLYHGLFIIGPKLAPLDVVEAAHKTPLNNPLYSLWAEGHTAVALFMVLSGFIFTVGAYRNTINYKQYISNRILRIYPLLLTVMIFNLAVSVEHFDWLSFVTTVLPLADLELGGCHAYVDMAWAVAVEFQFYLLFPFIINFFNRSVIRTALCIIGAALIARVICVYIGLNPRDIGYYHLIGRIDQFTFGMVAAAVWRQLEGREAALRRLFVVAMPGAICVIWWFHDLGGGFTSSAPWKIVWPTIEGLTWSLLILSYIGVGKVLPDRVSWILCRIGEMSFSIYLLHRVVLAAVDGVLQPTGLWDIDALATTLVYILPISIAVSYVSFIVIERPFLRARRRYTTSHDVVLLLADTKPVLPAF